MAATDNSAKTLDDFIAIEVRKVGRSASVTLMADPEPEPLFSPIISADDHALEPPNLFEGRLPSAMRDRTPYLETDDVGLQWWVIDEVRVPILMGNAAAGRDPREWSSGSRTRRSDSPACVRTTIGCSRSGAEPRRTATSPPNCLGSPTRRLPRRRF